VAEGRKLRLTQDDVTFSGHAIECRINAEDPARDDRPTPGRVTQAWFPAGPGIRVDTHIEPGREVPPWYDSLMAKIIVHGADRSDALDRMRAALRQCRIEGLASNLLLQRRITSDRQFRSGAVDTGWLARFNEAGPGA
jgi:acetyl-CoA carboxylase biotin carboxylase subunit